MTWDNSAAKRKAIRARWIKEGRCQNCGSYKLSTECKGFCDPCLVIRRRASRKYQQGLRTDAWEHYGGSRCACCGEDEPMFLTIDHINGGGNAHRKAISGEANSFYLWLKKNGYPPGFQVLCHNCNSGRWRNGGKCPHETPHQGQRSAEGHSESASNVRDV